MSLSTDLSFVQRITHRFNKYQRKSDYLFNVRCPLCGDSHKNKAKMRGYIYRRGNGLFYLCHNCGESMSLGNFIKRLDGTIHKEYVLEKYKSGEYNNPNIRKALFDVPVTRFGKVERKIFDNAERCDKLPAQHFCLAYLKNRKIPSEHYKNLYFTANYKKFCDEVYPNHGKEKLSDDARLVIPFYDAYDALIGVSGRALVTADYKLRYVTIKTNSSENKLIYGLDRIDTSQPIKIVEGPIDSLFLDNCVGSGDSSLSITAKQLNAEKTILIYDNEPRNKEIVNLMGDAIKQGHNIVVWPDTVDGKDINEMVMNGISSDEIEDIISNNTFKGIEAQINFNYWKKV